MRRALFVALSLAAPLVGQAATTTFVRTADGVDVALHRHTPTQTAVRSTPVLLVHGTWGSQATWTFPGRSSVEYLTARGYEVFAVDLRGMGASTFAGSYAAIGVLERVQDAAAAAAAIVSATGRKPVVIGWSQGGVVAALLAATQPGLVAGVGLFGVPAHGFYVDPALVPLITQVVQSGTDRWLPPPEVLFGGCFGFDPVTGQPTIDSAAFAQFVAQSQPDSLRAILEIASPEFWAAAITPAFAAIQVPALVVAGAHDAFVRPGEPQAVYELIGSADKSLTLLGRNAHGFFVEDNFHATMRVFDAFLAGF